jgi:uncharacterized protein (DUF58 family)
MTARALESSLVDLSDITKIELLLLRRVREATMGEHRSLFHGSGFDFVGLRDWEAGDRLSSINWPQSAINNFSPMVVSEFDQASTSSVIALADTSLSTRCGGAAEPIAAVIARALATIGLSAVFFQDSFGLLTFTTGFDEIAAVWPRIGRGQVLRCLDAYEHGQGLARVRWADDLSTTISSAIRRTSLVPVISDFLFDGADRALRELSLLDATHDVVIVLVDSAFAYDLPAVSASWIETFDVETGRSRLMSRRGVRRLAERARDWQDEIARLARDLDLDVVRLGLDRQQSDVALMQFVVERRLRKKT